MLSSKSAREAAQDLQRSFHQQQQQIAARTELTRDAKVGLLARAHTEARRRIEDLRTEHQAGVAKESLNANQKAFGIRNLEGDPAALAASLRDAQGRVEGVTTSEQAARLLTKAENSGDEVMARAVAGHAFEQSRTGIGMIDAGWGEILQSFVTNRPNLTDSVQTALDNSRPQPLDTSFYLPAPTELIGIPAGQLDILAAKAP